MFTSGKEVDFKRYDHPGLPPISVDVAARSLVSRPSRQSVARHSPTRFADVVCVLTSGNLNIWVLFIGCGDERKTFSIAHRKSFVKSDIVWILLVTYYGEEKSDAMR